jgi:hypothetical protein
METFYDFLIPMNCCVFVFLYFFSLFVLCRQLSSHRSGTKRKLRIHLDPLQYYKDMKDGNGECYEKLHLLVRRNPRENHFRPILQTMLNLLKSSSSTVVDLPLWLKNTVVGLGDIKLSHFR